GRRSRGKAAGRPGRPARPHRRPRGPAHPRGRVRRSPRGLAWNHGKPATAQDRNQELTGRQPKLTRLKLVLLSRDTWFGEMPCANSAFRPWRRSPRPRTSLMSCSAEQPQAVVLRRPSGPSGVAGESGSWTDVTASQFSGEVIALAKGLVAAGIEPGDRVALMSHTRYEWTLIDYAIWTAGAVTVPVYETSSAEQAEWILSDSGARACFVETASYGDIIGSFRDRVPAL